MRLLPRPRLFLKKRASKSYNSNNFLRSLYYGRFYYFIFRDVLGLDIAARSALNLKKFKLSSKFYSYATSKGIVLRNHEINYFNSELNSGNLVSAFKIGIVNNTELPQKYEKILLNEIIKLSDEEKFHTLKEMKMFGNLPNNIAPMFPEDSKSMKSNYENLPFKILEGDSKDEYAREVNRIKQSSSFIIGNHIVKSYKNPFKILFLPISLPYLGYRLLRGKGYIDINSQSSLELYDNNITNRNCIVFFPTNGVGFGHFTRLLAIARKLSSANPDLEIVFFTTMPTLHILVDDGFLTYHLPPRYRYDDMEPRVWNSLVEEYLNKVFSLHSPHTFIFDGSFPYRGMLNSIKQRNNMTRIWSRRGSFKKNSKSMPIDSFNHFDAIIRPGDSVSTESIKEVEHGVAVIRCNPITLVDESELAPKGELKSRLGIPDAAIVCYLQLGAGKINDTSKELSDTLDALSKHSEIYTVIGESILGSRISYDGPRVRVLRDYPNARYFSDFDFAVLAGGYNSYHEVIQMALPTLCYPNLQTTTDDQLARCMAAQKSGAMMVLENRNSNLIHAAINRISERGIREEMKLKIKLLQKTNGADQIATWFSNNIIK